MAHKRDRVDERLADIGGLNQFIAERRFDGASLHDIAIDIYEQTGIRVSGMTVQRWAEDRNQGAPEAKAKTRTRRAS